MSATLEFDRFKKMKRGDIWRDADGDYVLIKNVHKGWHKNKRSIKWINVEAILLSANSDLFVEQGYYSGQYFDDYATEFLVEKIA